MSMIRLISASFFGVSFLKNALKFDSVLAIVTLVSAIAATAFASGPATVAHAARSRPAAPFLSLPFVPNSRMNILSGWYYSSSGGLHNGIDFINGGVDISGSWRTFPIIASADGEACGNCSMRQGNAVWVKHEINGATYYTYYGHLASIATGIPLGSQSNTVWVKRGQVLGAAGDTGSRGALHLHFALYTASSQPIDPYNIGKLRGHYPKPDEQASVGWFTK